MSKDVKTITLIDASGRERRYRDMTGYKFYWEPGCEPDGHDGRPIPWETLLEETRQALSRGALFEDDKRQ